jgi:hypothetical protein
VRLEQAAAPGAVRDPEPRGDGAAPQVPDLVDPPVQLDDPATPGRRAEPADVLREEASTTPADSRAATAA